MYKTALFILGTLFTGSAFAQGTLTPALQDTLMLNQIEERNQINYRLSDDSTFTGVIVDYHTNGQLKRRKSVLDGKAEGLWMEWYDSGIVRYLGEWKAGKGHGTWMYFHGNGELSERSQVRNDVWDGISESWHKNGQKAFEGRLANNERVGEWIFWNEDGSRKEIKNYDKE